MKNRTWMVIGLVLLASSAGCRTTGMSRLRGLGWLGPKDADAVVTTQPSTELPPPSSAAVPNLPIKQATASQTSGQPRPTASAAVNTEPLKTYPATPYPNFQVAQANTPTPQANTPKPQNYTTGPYSTVATPVPSQNVQTLETSTNQPQPQQGFYDPNYDSTSRRSGQQHSGTYTPNNTPPQANASTSYNHVAPQNQLTANPQIEQQLANPNMPAAYTTPQQGYDPQHHQAAPIQATASTGMNAAPATYATTAQTTAASRADTISTSPSYYSDAQKQLGRPWRPGSTSCQDGACLASTSSEVACQDGACAPPQVAVPKVAVPQVAQPYQTQANSGTAAAQPEGSANRNSSWR